MFGLTGDENYCEISTIHAFCQNAILRHFYWRLGKYQRGYAVLAPDSDEYLAYVREVVQAHNLGPYARNQFELLNRSTTGQPIAQSSIPPEAALDFWARLENDGYMDFCNIVYLSFLLLKEFPTIAGYLAARYPYILVDEFQDTTDIQVEILNLIAGNERTTFFVVGDPEQSIFGFAGAKPELMGEFSATLGAENCSLSGNFRSSQPIVDCAESLISRTPNMFAAGESSVFTEQPVHFHVDSYFQGITDYFLPTIDQLGIPLGEAAILAHSWFDLFPLGRQLRNYGVPIVGPGARPYKKRHLLAGLAEQVCYYIDTPNSVLIPRIERELYYLVHNATGKPNLAVFNFEGRCTVFRLLEIARKQREKTEGASDWLLEVSEGFGHELVERGLLPSNCSHYLRESAEEIVSEMRTNKDLDASNLSVSDLGVFANPKENLKLLTMHSAKGREFQAVALISLHDGQIPYHNYYNPLTDEALEQARRLFYVAITRAERLLHMFSTSASKNPPSRFLNEIPV